MINASLGYFEHDFRFPHNSMVPLMMMLLAGWLDDVGLSQYKDQFNEARIDGRVLHYITVVWHIYFPLSFSLLV